MDIFVGVRSPNSYGQGYRAPNGNQLLTTDSYFAVGHSTRLLNFAADGECACDGKEVSALLHSVVVVAEAEMEVCCDVGADSVANAQRRLVTLGAFLAV